MVSKTDFNKICRICGSADGLCISLFSEAGKGYLFKVQKLLTVNISKDDGLPKNICHICMAYVSDFDTFRKQFGTVQTKLNQLSSNLQQGKSVNVSTTTNNISRNIIEYRNQDVHGEKISSIRRSHHESGASNQSCDSDNPEKNKIKADTESKDWSVHVVKGTNSTNKLHICKKCGTVLISESAIQSHECETPARLPQPQESDPLKRKRIIYEGEND